jgi:hypothetical protein
MTRLYFSFIVLIIVFSSCTAKRSNDVITGIDDTLVENNKVQRKSPMETRMDSLVIVRFNSRIEMDWDNVSSSFVENERYYSIKKQFQEFQSDLIQIINDTSLTEARSCSGSRNLSIGELSFLLIDQIIKIPYFDLFGVQFDVYRFGCETPVGLLEYVSKNRKLVTDRLTQFLCHHEC